MRVTPLRSRVVDEQSAGPRRASRLEAKGPRRTNGTHARCTLHILHAHAWPALRSACVAWPNMQIASVFVLGPPFSMCLVIHGGLPRVPHAGPYAGHLPLFSVLNASVRRSHGRYFDRRVKHDATPSLDANALRRIYAEISANEQANRPRQGPSTRSRLGSTPARTVFAHACRASSRTCSRARAQSTHCTRSSLHRRACAAGSSMAIPSF
eukprot:5949897-Pleurochrysis_carterae.AAC.3